MNYGEYIPSTERLVAPFPQLIEKLGGELELAQVLNVTVQQLRGYGTLHLRAPHAILRLVELLCGTQGIPIRRKDPVWWNFFTVCGAFEEIAIPRNRAWLNCELTGKFRTLALYYGNVVLLAKVLGVTPKQLRLIHSKQVQNSVVSRAVATLVDWLCRLQEVAPHSAVRFSGAPPCRTHSTTRH